jgi:hypothetical protein
MRLYFRGILILPDHGLAAVLGLAGMEVVEEELDWA